MHASQTLQRKKQTVKCLLFVVMIRYASKRLLRFLIEKDIDYFFKLDERGKHPLYQWEPKLQNNRIIAQHSVFVFDGVQVDAEAFVCHHTK